MSFIFDEQAIASMLEARDKSRRNRATDLARCSDEMLSVHAGLHGISFDTHGSRLATIQAVVEVEYPDLNEPTSPQEASPWFEASQVPASNDVENVYLTPQPMTEEYSDLGRPSPHEPQTSYDPGYIQIFLKRLYELVSTGATPEACHFIEDFFTANEPPLAASHAPLVREDTIARLRRLFGSMMSLESIETLTDYLFEADERHIEALGSPLFSKDVEDRIRHYMTGAWSQASVDAVVRVALTGQLGEPTSPSWPPLLTFDQPLDERTQINPIVTPGEKDPSSDQPSYYEATQP